jgi:hypothetical protein
MRRREPIMRPGLPLVLIAGVVLVLGACSQGTAGSASHAEPTPTVGHPVSSIALTCTFHELPQPNMNVFTGFLSCQVRGAASADTAFTLTYSLDNVVCRGKLVHGTGDCTASFIIQGGQLSSLGTVAGEVLPSRQPLGPVAPLPAP